MILTTSCSAQSVTVSIDQPADGTDWKINRRKVSEIELNRLLTKIASLDSNQIVQVVAHTNVSATALVQTLGIIQRAGFQKLIIVSSGTDNSTNGTWRLTADFIDRGLPGCIPAAIGFTAKDIKDLDVEIEPYVVEEEPRRTESK